MKKFLFLVVAIVFACGRLSAGSVNVNTAQTLGQKFVQANFEQNRQAANLELVYTVNSEAGDPCFYVFNVADNGFIIVSASDCVRPILGYSDESTFDVDNIAPGLNHFLGIYKTSISYAIDNLKTAEVSIASEWENLEKYGKVNVSRSGSVGPLLTTKWNQDSPYNLYAPAAPSGPGGRCYAGCVATAMSMVMEYWDHPTQGTGSHSYYCPGYGQQSANFGQTTYHHELMPPTLSGATQEQIEAVALLMYHCGVAVDMGYSPEGSGAYSVQVPAAIQTYFSYAPSNYINRSSYTLSVWINMLKEAFDCGRPVYYSGQSPDGGHAFACDGYDDNDLIHFNFGWGGSGNGYFSPDAIDYNSQDGAIMNFMPQNVYNNTAQAPTNLNVTPGANNALSATISWTNPSKTLNNSNISAIDQIIVTRNGQVAYLEENPTPGASVTYTDDNVPCFNVYDYKVYAVINGAHGYIASVNDVHFGPTCEWNVILSTTSIPGLRGANVYVMNSANRVVSTATTTSSTPTTAILNVPFGNVKFGWNDNNNLVDSMSTINIKIRDASNTEVYTYSGRFKDMEEGIFMAANNNCGNSEVCATPANLYASSSESSVTLNWDGVEDKGYGYNIYRDGVLYQMVQENTFTDENVILGGYCYSIKVLCDGGESEASNESCANIGEGCDAPKDLWFEYTATFKPKLTWTRPESEGLSGYYIYRRVEGETEWTRIKLAGASATSYSDNSSLVDGTWYQYRVQAYYQETDCTSAPANNKNFESDFYVRVYYSVDGVEEINMEKVSVYPNPTSDKLNIKAEGMNTISVFNLMGQKVLEVNVDADQIELDVNSLESGIYMIRIVGSEFDMTKRISVVK